MNSLQFKILLLLVFVFVSQGLTIDRAEHNSFSADLNAIRKDELRKHNDLRGGYNLKRLQLDDNLNKEAQAIAQRFAKDDKVNEKNATTKYGINIQTFSNFFGDSAYKGGDATQWWIMQKMMFNSKKPVYSDKTKKFTQLIWKSTQKVGFGYATSKSGVDYVVALYDPKGNIKSQFAKNIPKK